MLRYNALYFTYSPPPHENTISAKFCTRRWQNTADSPKHHPNVVLLNNDIWLRNISTKFRRFLKQRSILFPILFAPITSQNCLHYNVSSTLCLINAASSSSSVFRSQNPIILYYRIVPIKKTERYSPARRKKLPYKKTIFPCGYHP